ncbi:ribosomal-processing cysteine protease Prp [Barrientosiimonas marina]|uniref:Ribosomal processing cysteine protease Prp n=1 Tax=Lentibacillus kimchii TaxID=1542911 RepID=A0ABW2UVS3_9BACI
MIQVTIDRQDSRISQFEMSGHAESGPYGYDLVCAGVSAVSFGSINAVMTIAGTELAIEQDSDGGFLRVTVPSGLSEDVMNKVQLLLEGMLVSLRTIERDYNTFIRITEHEEVL